MRNQLLAGAAALAIIVPLQGPVHAADMPVKAPGAVAPSVFNWSGFYTGGHLGWGSGKFASTISQPGEDRRGKGWVGGLQSGYLFQNGNIVWGAELDTSISSFNNNISDNFFHTDSLSSVRARLGIAMDRVLFYATGGWALVHGKVLSSNDGVGAGLHHYNKSKAVVGGGIEWAATNNLSYRLEVLDYLGKTSLPSEDEGGNKLKNIVVARVGFNYRFGPDGKGPVPVVGLPVKASVGPGPFNWSGLYLGGHLGWAKGKFAALDDSVPGASNKAKGGLGGGQLGYNLQTGQIVWGVVGDISAGTRRTEISDNLYINDLLASVRGKLGIAFDRILVFGTAGYGYVHGKTVSSSATTTVIKFHKFKPVVSVGIDYAATQNLIYTFEVLDYLKTTDIGGLNDNADQNRLKNIWAARFAVSYKFDGSGWGKGPLVAKY
jgi:outer membrane immunogenic protein